MCDWDPVELYPEDIILLKYLFRHFDKLNYGATLSSFIQKTLYYLNINFAILIG